MLMLSQFGKPEVEDLDATVPGYEYVLGLEVTMDDAALVSGSEPADDLDAVVGRGLDG
jgi:hypothetical protein